MAQLYTQRQVTPDSWDMSGDPQHTSIALSVAATINYSDDPSHPDTLPANTLALLPDGTSTSFDRTADVYIPYVIKGDATLRIIKESLLPTLTSDYGPLARVELHGIKPYQPEPYLASGALGGGAGTTTSTYLSALDATTKALSLWNGSSNDTPPANWSTTGFDDSAWPLAVISHEESLGDISPWPPAAVLWSTTIAHSDAVLCRAHFTPPVGTITAATLDVFTDLVPGAYVNGTFVGSDPVHENLRTFTIPPSALHGGADNVLAIEGLNYANIGDVGGNLAYRVIVTYAGSARTEGDLLYFHEGLWTDLPIGSSGQELTVVSGDPAWATPPAGYADPLTTKGDLLGRSASATVRLGVGSNGQVLTADSTAADGLTWATPASGSVTSVALAGPTGTTVSGSPITSSGTLTLSWASQTANTVLAAPTGSAGAPTFRVLAAADIPTLPASQITTGQVATARGGTGLDGSAAANGTLLIGNGSGYSLATLTAGSGIAVVNSAGGISIAATGSGGTVTSVALTVPGFLSVSGSPITTGGTLAVTLANENANTVFAGPSAGSAAAPTFRALQGSDLPAAAAAGGHIHAHVRLR